MTVDVSEGNENMDYAQHQQSYEVFISLVKYGIISVVVILVLMAMFLG